MKRAIKWWPKFNLTSPEKSDFIFGASYGLITIQAYHELDMMKLAQGKNKTIIGLLRAQVKNTVCCIFGSSYSDEPDGANQSL